MFAHFIQELSEDMDAKTAGTEGPLPSPPSPRLSPPSSEISPPAPPKARKNIEINFIGEANVPLFVEN